MGFENINLWFAKDSNNKTVLAKDITKNIKHKNYICPICNSCVIPKTGDVMTWHFAHKDASKCNSETMIHWWIKNELIKVGDKFKVNIQGKITKYECKELKIEQQYKTSKGIYKPDITIITTSGEVIYVEIEHTNKKKIRDFIDIWEELNHTVVEVETRDIINGNKIEYMKAIWYEGKEYYEQLNELRSVCDKEKEKYKFTKEQVDKIDWLISDICKYNQGLINIDVLSDEIQLIEDKYERDLVVNIVKNKKCGNILNKYTLYNKNRIEKIFYEKYYNVKIPRIVYDRVYGNYNIQKFSKYEKGKNVNITDINNLIKLSKFCNICSINNHKVYKEYLKFCNEKRDLEKTIDDLLIYYDKNQDVVNKNNIKNKLKHRYLILLYNYLIKYYKYFNITLSTNKIQINIYFKEIKENIEIILYYYDYKNIKYFDDLIFELYNIKSKEHFIKDFNKNNTSFNKYNIILNNMKEDKIRISYLQQQCVVEYDYYNQQLCLKNIYKFKHRTDCKVLECKLLINYIKLYTGTKIENFDNISFFKNHDESITYKINYNLRDCIEVSNKNKKDIVKFILNKNKISEDFLNKKKIIVKRIYDECKYYCKDFYKKINITYFDDDEEHFCYNYNNGYDEEISISEDNIADKAIENILQKINEEKRQCKYNNIINLLNERFLSVNRKPSLDYEYDYNKINIHIKCLDKYNKNNEIDRYIGSIYINLNESIKEIEEKVCTKIRKYIYRN